MHEYLERRRMRTVLLALAMIALVIGAWWVARQPRGIERDGSNKEVDAAPALVAGPSNAPSPRVDGDGDGDGVSARVAVEAAAPSVNALSSAPTAAPPTDRGVPPTFRSLQDEPEYRSALVAELVKSGLSPLDSERVADSAIEGFSECAATSGFGRASPQAFAACNSNVLQQAGVTAALNRRAVTAAASETSRRRALEAAAAAEAR
jgi:hypothetical protein